MNRDDIPALLSEAGADRRALGEALRRERDPKTAALRQEGSATSEQRMAALEHEATVRGFARLTLAFRYREGGGVDYRYVEVRDKTTSFERSPRYVYWVTEFSGSHTGLSRDEALILMAEVLT